MSQNVVSMDVVSQGDDVSFTSEPDNSRSPRSVKFNEEESRPETARYSPVEIGEQGIEIGEDGTLTTVDDSTRKANAPYESLRKTKSVMLKFFPKMKPVPLDAFVALFLLSLIPSIAYLALFTAMGVGSTTFYFLSTNYKQYASDIAYSLAIVFFLLYISDSNEWSSKCGSIARKLSYTIFILGVALLVFFVSSDYPYGPVCVYAVFLPLWLILNKMVFLPQKDVRVFIGWLSGPFLLTAFFTMISWMTWVFLDMQNRWTNVTRLHAAEESACVPNFEDIDDCRLTPDSDDVCFTVDIDENKILYPEGCAESCTQVYDDCLNSFILWVGPMLVSATLFFLSFMCTFMRAHSETENGVATFGKIWLFLLFIMWVSASLAGAGRGVTPALAALTLAGFIGTTVFFAVSFSREDRKARRKIVWSNIKADYGGWLDVFRGLIVLTCTPVILVYFAFSVVTQAVRKMRLPFSKTISDLPEPNGIIESEDFVTKKTRKHIGVFKSWDRVKVSTYAIYWGLAFMTVQVIVSQFTLLLLSWLIDTTADYSLIVTTGILFGVGVVLFLLPPVPGVPIYLTMGIVIPAIARDTFGWTLSIAYCTVVSIILKLFACALQQKAIGESLSNSVSVRQLVGINTHIIKAMRVILEEKGMSIAKVTILVGGPDWPTSVLCGILRLDLLPILFGTLPVIFLIFPTILTGTFTYMASLQIDGSPEFGWAGVAATLAATLTAGVQGGSMVVAAYYLDKTASERGEDIEKIPIDEEVRVSEARAEAMNQKYTDITQWNVVPLWAKGILCSSVCVMVTSLYMVNLFSTQCFTEYELTDTIEEELDGDWTNLILPIGRVALLLFVISLTLFFVFSKWATHKAAVLVDEMEQLTEEEAAPNAPSEHVSP